MSTATQRAEALRANDSVRRQSISPSPDQDEQQPIAGIGDNRLAVLTAELLKLKPLIRRRTLQAAEAVLAAGHHFIEVREIIKHGDWLAYLKKVGYSTRTAQLYMQLAKRGVKCETVAHFGMRGALKTIRAHLENAKSAEQARKRKPSGKATSRRSFRWHGYASLKEMRRDRERCSKLAKKRGLPDPNKQWARPTKDGEVLFVEWATSRGRIQRAYIWLPMDAHAEAAALGAADGPGPSALRYRWIILNWKQDDEDGTWRGDHRRGTDEWKTLAGYLNSSWSLSTDGAAVEEIWDIDPINLEILSDLRCIVGEQWQKMRW